MNLQKKLTLKWLKEKNACRESIVEYKKLGEKSLKEVFAKLKEGKNYDWLNWLLSRLFTKKQCIRYAIFSAEQVLDNFEKVYPKDKRPRLAIKAAKNYLKNPTKRNRSAADSAAYSAARSADSAAYSAARSADSAAYSAYSAYSAAYSAARSAYSAARSADSAAYSAYSAYSAARSAYSAARSAYSAARSAMKLKICNYGIKLLGAK
jgi:hypothetical protein